jgi:acyl carrier protein
MQRDAVFRRRFEEVLRRNLHLEGDDEVAVDCELASYGLDSAGVITLLLELEETFGISLPEALLIPETFRTRATLERVVGTLAGLT